MDLVDLALAIILGIGMLEGLYLLIKSRKVAVFDDEEKGEQLIRVKVWDAMRLGFGFMLGVLLFMILFWVATTILGRVGLALPELPLSIFR